MRTFRNNNKRGRFRSNDRNFKRNGEVSKFNSDFSTNTNFQRNVSSIKNKIKFNTASPIKVAKYGYDALNNNVTVSIPGTFNKFLVNLNRFLPRSISTNIVKYILRFFKIVDVLSNKKL